MSNISIPCHACGHDNPSDTIQCAICQAVISLTLQPVRATQQLQPVGKVPTEEERLIMEAYYVVALLLQSVHRLRALIDQKRGDC
jgi:hypothetical protein